MIYHQLGHTAVNADILACDEASLVGTEEHHHIGDIHWVSYTARRLLQSFRPLIYMV